MTAKTAISLSVASNRRRDKPETPPTMKLYTITLLTGSTISVSADGYNISSLLTSFRAGGDVVAVFFNHAVVSIVEVTAA